MRETEGTVGQHHKKYTIIPTKITINPQDKMDLLKHHRIAIHQREIIYSVEHHV